LSNFAFARLEKSTFCLAAVNTVWLHAKMAEEHPAVNRPQSEADLARNLADASRIPDRSIIALHANNDLWQQSKSRYLNFD